MSLGFLFHERYKGACLLMLFLYCTMSLLGQDVGETGEQKVTVKEWELEAAINTNGITLGFQQGWTPDHFNKHFWEVNFVYNQHHKAVRGSSPISSPYTYGKLCDLFFLRGGYGYQRILNHKPYWGGVQVRFTFSGGFSLGMGLPVYINVYNNNNELVSERYDPENVSYHTVGNITGRAGFFNGISKTMLRPGFYAKTGIQFDFSKNNLTIHALEVGATIDMVFPYIQQMAYNKAKPFYLCAYVAYHFGKKKGHYE